MLEQNILAKQPIKTPFIDEEFESEELEAKLDAAQADFKAGRIYSSEQMNVKLELLFKEISSDNRKSAK